jgi:hypothetical protein
MSKTDVAFAALTVGGYAVRRVAGYVLDRPGQTVLSNPYNWFPNTTKFTLTKSLQLKPTHEFTPKSYTPAACPVGQGQLGVRWGSLV